MEQDLLFGVELLMEEDGAMIGEVYFVEVVHVELSDEGREAIVSVVPGEYVFF